MKLSPIQIKILTAINNGIPLVNKADTDKFFLLRDKELIKVNFRTFRSLYTRKLIMLNMIFQGRYVFGITGMGKKALEGER